MANRTITKQTELMLKELNTPECKLIVQETYQTAIDIYTFRRELEWTFGVEFNPRRTDWKQLAPEIKKLIKHLVHKKDELVRLRAFRAFHKEVDWILIAIHFHKQFESDPDVNFNEYLNSFHQAKYYKDSRINDSGAYTLVKHWAKDLSTGHTYIQLVPVAKFK